jgi:hypothetical protein
MKDPTSAGSPVVFFAVSMGLACTGSDPVTSAPDSAAPSQVSLRACIAGAGLGLEELTTAPDEIVCPTQMHDEVYFRDQPTIEKVAERLGGDPASATWL